MDTEQYRCGYNRQPDVDTQVGRRVVTDRMTGVGTQEEPPVGMVTLMGTQGHTYGHSPHRDFNRHCIWLNLDHGQTFLNRHGQINSIR